MNGDDQEQVLCQLEDIPDGQARGFLPVKRDDQVFAVRRAEQLFVYMNACPHEWVPMDFARHRFLSADGAEILCYAHGAHFTLDEGLCTSGPCLHQRLIKINHRVVAGAVLIPLVLPTLPRTRLG